MTMTNKPPNKIAVRCYTEKPEKRRRKKEPHNDSDEPEDSTLVFDCETTTDEV